MAYSKLPINRHYASFLRLILVSMLSLGLAARVVSAGEQEQDKPTSQAYVLGVFPHLPPKLLSEVFTPIAMAMGSAIDRPMKLRSAPSFEAFQFRLARGDYDIAFIQPFDYVDIAQPHGYIPLAARNEDLTSVVTVKKGKSINALADLQGRALAMPPVLAAVTRIFLNSPVNAQIEPYDYFHIFHTNNHMECLHLLDIDQVAGCVTAISPLNIRQSAMQSEYRIIDISPPYPHVLFAAAPHVSAVEQNQLRNALTALTFKDIGRPKAFASVSHRSLFRPVEGPEYDAFRNFKHYSLQSSGRESSSAQSASP